MAKGDAGGLIGYGCICLQQICPESVLPAHDTCKWSNLEAKLSTSSHLTVLSAQCFSQHSSGPRFVVTPSSCPRAHGSDHKLAVPCGSKGRKITINPAAMNNAPLVYTGAEVWRFANMAIIGAMIPKTRFAVAVRALPVPRSYFPHQYCGQRPLGK